MLLVIDNYDSFTYNLVQYLAELGAEVAVYRNDAIDVAGIAALAPEAVVVSPGPGRPESAGVSVPLIRELGGRLPILGVCLGHQAIGLAFGGRVGLAPVLMHGKTSAIRHDGSPLYAGVENPFTATRYHSLIVERDGLPGELEVAAETEDGVVMGLHHRTSPLHGVQFHPESILTPAGRRILGNFLALAAAFHAGDRAGERAGDRAGDRGEGADRGPAGASPAGRVSGVPS